MSFNLSTWQFACIHFNVEYQRTNQDQEILHGVTCPDHLILTDDGRIHNDTFKHRVKDQNKNRPLIKSENIAVADVGATIYDALDFGVGKSLLKEFTICNIK